MTDIVKRLRDAEAFQWEYDTCNCDGLLSEAADRIEALEAENAKLREALEPFARAAEHAEADMTICGLPTDDANEFEVGWGINAGYCIAARAALGGTSSRARAREVDGQASDG